MPTPTELTTWPFLSVVAWPEGWDRASVAQLLAGFGAMDLPTLNLRLGQKPPMVLNHVDPSVAPAMIAALVDRGGDGFSFTLDDLARLGPTMRIADLAVGEGTLDIKLHDGLETSIRSATVDVIVRARIVSTVTRINPVRRPMSLSSRPYRTLNMIKDEIKSQTTKEIQTTELLDLHTGDGSVYRIDGRRFGYKALGAMRGHSDKANMDSMLELLTHVCPDAVVDTYYELWRPPPGHRKLRVPGMKAARDDPAFVFYSRWAALTYRHVMSYP